MSATSIERIVITDDDVEDDENLPFREECEEMCTNFAHITSTDSAFAMMKLQQVHWNIEVALEEYFSQKSSTSKTTTKIPQPVPQSVDPEPERVRVLSWNIDGLDDKQLHARTTAVCDVIERDKPHIALLQEVTVTTQPLLEAALPAYHFIPSSHQGYYTLALFNALHTTVSKHDTLPFPQSLMARNLLDVVCVVKGVAVRVMTSHLESTKEHRTERLRQLKCAFDEMCNTPEDIVAIFGGDLNLRDSELSEYGGVPVGVQDVWEASGARDIAKYTWDMARNHNLQFPGKWKPRTRFDRLYIRPRPTPGITLRPVYFELVGLEKVKGSQMFPSDHWGILAHFDKVAV